MERNSKKGISEVMKFMRSCEVLTLKADFHTLAIMKSYNIKVLKLQIVSAK